MDILGTEAAQYHRKHHGHAWQVSSGTWERGWRSTYCMVCVRGFGRSGGRITNIYIVFWASKRIEATVLVQFGSVWYLYTDVIIWAFRRGAMCRRQKMDWSEVTWHHCWFAAPRWSCGLEGGKVWINGRHTCIKHCMKHCWSPVWRQYWKDMVEGQFVGLKSGISWHWTWFDGCWFVIPKRNFGFL